MVNNMTRPNENKIMTQVTPDALNELLGYTIKNISVATGEDGKTSVNIVADRNVKGITVSHDFSLDGIEEVYMSNDYVSAVSGEQLQPESV
jgi:hypothetical protein